MNAVSDSFGQGADGTSLSPKEVARYSRHLIMPEVGMEGQKRLKAARTTSSGCQPSRSRCSCRT